MEEKKKAKATIGVFAGILNRDTGKLLLMRRIEEHSIIPGASFKGNYELPGGAVMEADAEKIPYDYLVKELQRRLMKKIGAWSIEHLVGKMPAAYPVFFKGPEGYDLAIVTVLETITEKFPTGETCWVSPDELKKLANEFVPADKKKGKDGEGLLSGWGKRMHCMALKALCFSSNKQYAQEAEESLMVLQSSW